MDRPGEPRYGDVRDRWLACTSEELEEARSRLARRSGRVARVGVRWLRPALQVRRQDRRAVYMRPSQLDSGKTVHVGQDRPFG